MVRENVWEDTKSRERGIHSRSMAVRRIPDTLEVIGVKSDGLRESSCALRDLCSDDTFFI